MEIEEDLGPGNLFDIAILGGGPVGLYATYYSGLRGMRTLLLDSLPQLGGQLATLYPEKYIFDVPGFPKILARDLVGNLIEQASQYSPTIAVSQCVTDLTVSKQIVTLKTASGCTFYSKAAILSAGMGAFSPRKINVDNLERFEGKGVHYFVGDKSVFAGKRLMIVGGGDSAFDWALNLSDVAKSIVLIHRSDKFRAHEDTVLKVRSLPVTIKTYHEVKALDGADHLNGVTIFDNKTMEEQHHDVDHILFNLGYFTNLGPIKDWGLDIVGSSISVSSKMETNKPLVFAAGDIVSYVGKLKLISTGFGEAAIAVNHAKAMIDPKSKAFPGHSSDAADHKAAVH